MKMEDLTGRVAVITGASSGIGEAAARLLAAEGVELVLVARRADRIRALAEELGDAAVAIAADFGVGAQVAAVFDQVRERFGGLDLLFNNAGVGIYGAFLESKPEDWKTQIDANIYGVLNSSGGPNDASFASRPATGDHRLHRSRFAARTERREDPRRRRRSPKPAGRTWLAGGPMPLPAR